MFSADHQLGSHRWHVIRLVAGSQTEVVLLSDSFFALTTHWVKSTVPCPGEDCKLCETLPSRGLFYAAAHCQGRIMILELGAQSASHFEQHAKLLHQGMRPGLIFQLTRRSAKTPVRSECLGFKEGARSVSKLELAQKVMAVYKFPPPNVGEDLCDYEVRCRGMAKLRTDRIAQEAAKASKC